MADQPLTVETAPEIRSRKRSLVAKARPAAAPATPAPVVEAPAAPPPEAPPPPAEPTTEAPTPAVQTAPAVAKTLTDEGKDVSANMEQFAAVSVPPDQVVAAQVETPPAEAPASAPVEDELQRRLLMDQAEAAVVAAKAKITERRQAVIPTSERQTIPSAEEIFAQEASSALVANPPKTPAPFKGPNTLLNMAEEQVEGENKNSVPLPAPPPPRPVPPPLPPPAPAVAAAPSAPVAPAPAPTISDPEEEPEATAPPPPAPVETTSVTKEYVKEFVDSELLDLTERVSLIQGQLNRVDSEDANQNRVLTHKHDQLESRMSFLRRQIDDANTAFLDQNETNDARFAQLSTKLEHEVQGIRATLTALQSAKKHPLWLLIAACCIGCLVLGALVFTLYRSYRSNEETPSPVASVSASASEEPSEAPAASVKPPAAPTAKASAAPTAASSAPTKKKLAKGEYPLKTRPEALQAVLDARPGVVSGTVTDYVGGDFPGEDGKNWVNCSKASRVPVVKTDGDGTKHYDITNCVVAVVQ